MAGKFISVSGTLGVGKTTLVKLLTEEFGCTPFFENFQDNPFLSDFYRDMPRWSFHSQIFFLVEKMKQIGEIANLGKGRFVIQDTPIYQDVYSYAKAHQILGYMKKDEWDLYVRSYRIFEKEMRKPDLIIHLYADIDSIYDRVVKRSRSYEMKRKKQEFIRYLRVLDVLNKKWLKKIKNKIPLLTIDAGGSNYINDRKVKRKFVQSIRKIMSEY